MTQGERFATMLEFRNLLEGGEGLSNYHNVIIIEHW
jgi:hypothetical protein